MKKKTNKDKILDQAAALIDADSLEHITIREICRQAGVSIGSFYHYFSSKDDVIVQLFLSNADQAESLVRNHFHAEWEWDNLRSYIQFQINSTLASPVERLKLVREILVHAREKGQMNDSYTYDEILDHLFTLILGNMIRYCIEDGNYDIAAKLMGQVNHLISFIEKKET